ncbi:MAG: site-specific integrase [Bacteroidota bacterium]
MANNIVISTPTVVGGNIQFNIQWDNSWNTAVGPTNYDAVWVFVKRQVCGGAQTWDHSLLSTVSGNHSVTSGVLQVDAVTDGVGVFIRRSAVGNGNIASSLVTLNLQTAANLVDINEDAISMVKSPFTKYKLKWEQVDKNYLTESELLALDRLILPLGSCMQVHKDIYVFAAYTAGLRISDIFQLRWRDFDGEKICIKTKKTGSIVSIKLPNKSKEILEKYKSYGTNHNNFVFPILTKYENLESETDRLKAISSANAYVNKDLVKLTKLAKIDKHIHFHTSRHTFATRALRKGMRIEYVSKLMGHSNIKTTQIYAKIVNEELDKAMDVFND